MLSWRTVGLCVVMCLCAGTTGLAAGDDRLVGTWSFEEDFQVTEILFRPNGRYQMDTRSTDPTWDLSTTERGYYKTNGNLLTLTVYEQSGTPEGDDYEFQVSSGSLTLSRLEFPQVRVYQYKPGSREDVLARQAVAHNPIRRWLRTVEFYGTIEYTFRPGGYYVVKRTPEGDFPPQYIRGRYGLTNDVLTIHPYSGTPLQHEADFFGTNLTLIKSDGFYTESETYNEIPGSLAEVTTKSAAAETFLGTTNWQVGIWEVRDDYQTTDLTIRPDGYYSATNAVQILRGMVRGRYTLEPRRIQLFPFVGQGIYSPDNGEFGKVPRTREIDYYDGELQFIDLTSISQWVTIARKRPGSQAVVMDKSQQAQIQRAAPGWQVGIWEVNDPTGWMQFTFRPDNRYIAKSGSGGVPFSVERGRCIFAAQKITLAPYSGLGTARGFDLDLYDGDLFLIGDAFRMVIARKLAGSETEVIAKTQDPDSMKGEGGSILGRWTSNIPGQNVELVFRPDGHFRLKRCANNIVSQDYGLYSANVTARSLVYDSRFLTVQSQGLDFYGNTLTIFGGLGSPSTYTVNLGTVNAAIAASHAADAQEALVDAQWLARVPIAPRNPNATQNPIQGIPPDPNPGIIFNSPTVFTNYHLYRRLIPSFVYWSEQGTIKSVAVVNTREWHFFPTGRVLVRFRNYFAGPSWPITDERILDSWGAYRIDPKPAQQDILHVFADNVVFLQSDSGEPSEMTLEDGRRHLFWGKEYMLLSEWAAEQQNIPCQLPGDPDPNLSNSGVALSTTIPPDSFGGTDPGAIHLAPPVSGSFTLSGTWEGGGTLVIERTGSLTPPIAWRDIQTNNVAGGAFNLAIPQGTNTAGYFRLRVQ